MFTHHHPKEERINAKVMKIVNNIDPHTINDIKYKFGHRLEFAQAHGNTKLLPDSLLLQLFLVRFPS